MIHYHGFDIEALTPELAEEFATAPAFVGERALRPARKAELHSKLESGRFFSPRWATATHDGKLCRVNGQHSSTVLAEANGHFPHGLDVIVDRFTCDTPEDLAELFSQFDPKFSSRTTVDVLNANGRVHKSLDDVTPSMLKAATNGITFCLAQDAGISIKSFSDNDRGRLIHEHREYMLFRHALGHCRMLKKIGVEGAIYRTWQRDPDAAHDFWFAVRDATAPSNTDATRVLNHFLLTSVNDADRGTGRAWSTVAFYVKSIHAWNAWRDGTGTSLKYHHKAAPPKAK